MIIFNTISLDSILISNKRFLTWYDIAQNIANLIAFYIYIVTFTECFL